MDAVKLMEMNEGGLFMTIDEILSKEEGQTFDHKSIMIKPTDLSDTVRYHCRRCFR